MRARLRSMWAGVWFCAVVITPLALGQVTTGTISGTVTDSSGAVVPGAAIKVANVETGFSREAQTDPTGRFRFPALPLGQYSVEARMSGFEAAVRSGIQLTVGRDAVVDLQLQTGAVSERVEITGEAPIVQTTDSTIAYLVDNKTMRDLPLNGRSYSQLALLQPNVTGVTLYIHNASSGTGINLSVQGQRQTQNLFLLDGTEANAFSSRTPAGVGGNSLGVEAIREFTLLSGMYSAEYGHFLGGVLNMVTRSGTNGLHGNAYDFIRNSALDAKNFFDLATAPIPAYRRNQFGGTLGGPIKKDRMFFFGSYEGLRELKTLTSSQTVPNLPAHSGILPSGRVTINPAIQPLLDALPLPNGRDFGDGTGALIVGRGQVSRQDYWVTRFDAQLSPKHSLFGRYTFDDSAYHVPEPIPVFMDLASARNQFVTISLTSTFSPSTLNTLTVGATRSSATSTSTNIASYPAGYTFLAGVEKIGDYTIQSPSIPVGDCPSCRREDPRNYHLNQAEVDEKITHQITAHAFTFGGTFKRYGLNEISNSQGSNWGYAVFQNLSNFLQGQAFSFAASIPGFNDVERGLRASLVGFFFQDDYRVKSNLTLNLGVRWEMSTSPTEVNGKITSLANPLTDSTLVHPGAYTTTGKKNFAPRVGFAWDPFSKGKTSIRGGFGIFYDIMVPYNFPLGVFLAGQPPYNQVVTLRSNIVFPRPFDALHGVFPTQTLSLSFIPSHSDMPARNFWTFGIQQQLQADTMFSATYTGSRTVHLPLRNEMNFANPVLDANGQLFFPTTPTGGNLPGRNPAFGSMTILDYSGYSFYNALAVSLTRRLSKGLRGQVAYTFAKGMDVASTIYGGGNTGPEAANAATGIQYWYNRNADYGPGTFSIKHSFVANTVWDLPLGQHQGAPGKLLGGWQLMGIVTRNSGLPFTAQVGFLRSRSVPTGSGADRPNLAAGASNNPVLGGPDRYFDPNAFVLQPAGYFGNLGKSTLVGPGFFDMDISLVKQTKITERTNLEFRSEFFNALNHPNFGRMNTVLFSSTGARVGNAGSVVDTMNDSREIQFGLKFSF